MRMVTFRLVSVGCFFVLLAGCGGGGGGSDTSTGTDTSSPQDIPVTDLGTDTATKDTSKPPDVPIVDQGSDDPGCTPDCKDKTCGDNGCGGNCGTCGDGLSCMNGKCTASSCLDPADMAIIEGSDVEGVALECGIGCLGGLDEGSCTHGCIVEQTGLSAECSGCVSDMVLCAIQNCTFACLDPESGECATCKEENGCIDTFVACSGLSITCTPDCNGLQCGDGGCPVKPDACGICSAVETCDTAGQCI